MTELAGRVALVTGGVRNIGAAISLALAEAGAAIAVNSRSASADATALVEKIRERGGRAIHVAADITDEAAVDRMVAEIAGALGPVAVLVNNAASRGLSPIGELSLADWRAAMAVMLDGPFLCSRACLPGMPDEVGRIINLGGVSAHRGAVNRVHATAAKGGVVGLTRGLAIELAPRHITVNCIVPGPIETVRDANAGQMPAHPQGMMPPIGRHGRPDEIAAMVRLLAGPAGAFVTGQCIHINGGLYLA